MSSLENQDFRVMAEEAGREQDREREQPKHSEGRAKVRFFGDDIGFQFSQTGQGSRSRTAYITEVHAASEKELEEISEVRDADRSIHKYGAKTKRRTLLWWNEDFFKIYVGRSSFRFKGGEPRLVKVGCVRYKDTAFSQCRWESYKSIYDEEGEEA